MPMTKTVVVAAAIAIGLGVAGCGGGDNAESTTSAESSSSSAAASSSASPTITNPVGPLYTVADYLQDNNFEPIPVARDTPGAPQLNLPVPDGWESTGDDVPQDAWGAIVLTAAKGTPQPPAIIARMIKLSDEVDQGKILEYAPNAVRKLPGWDGPDKGAPGQLSGFESVQIAGKADVDGQPTFVARKTVIIPGADGIYVLALDGQGPLDQVDPILAAMAVIDEQTTIVP